MPDVKIRKDGQEYGIGVIPQSLYDDVEDLKDANTLVDIWDDVTPNTTAVSNVYAYSTHRVGKVLKFYVVIGLIGGLSDGTELFSLSGINAVSANTLIYNNNKQIVGTADISGNKIKLYFGVSNSSTCRFSLVTLIN